MKAPPPLNAVHKPKGYWLQIENRRAELMEFAKEVGFDPLVPENWHNVSTPKFAGKRVPAYYILLLQFAHFIYEGNWNAFYVWRELEDGSRGVLPRTTVQLSYIVPHTGLHTHSMMKGMVGKAKSYWADGKTCRTFFEDFARRKGFDPLQVYNWQSLDTEELLGRTVRLLSSLLSRRADAIRIGRNQYSKQESRLRACSTQGVP